MTVLTSLPVQNTVEVKAIYDISKQCIEDQLKAIFDDIHIDAIKIGMLHRTDIIETVSKILSHYNAKNIILDPVMVAKSGDRLLLPCAITAMKEQLFPIATIITPNLLEASEILNQEILTKEDMEKATLHLIDMGPKAVIVKGGHLNGNCDDCLCFKNPEKTIHWFSQPRIPTKNTHGTGCTFSAAIASYIAQGFSILDSVGYAKRYLTQAIEAGAHLKIGHGHGPVHHFYHLWNQQTSTVN